MKRALERGHLEAGWVAGMTPLVCRRPSVRAGGLGNAIRPGRSGGLHGVAGGSSVDQSSLSGTGHSSQAQAGGWAAAFHGGGRSAAPNWMNCLKMPGRRSRWPREAQGPRIYQFSAQRVRPTSRRKPGETHWAIWRRNLDGSEPRYYLSNAPEDTPLETLAYVGGSRWRIETEFETEKSDVGMDEYEILGRVASPHSPVLAGRSIPADCNRLGGKKMPQITRPQVYRVVREMLPRERFGPGDNWLEHSTPAQRAGQPLPRQA